MINIRQIDTEKRNIQTKDIDKVSTKEIMIMINNQDQTIANNVLKSVDSISDVVDEAVKIIKKGGKVFYIGAGTSGRLGILDASEMMPTFGEKDFFVGIIAGGEKAIQFPVEHSEDDENQAIIDLKNNNFTKNDLLIGIAASGRTPYVVSAINYANSLNSSTASISTSLNSEIGKIAKIKIDVYVGPETITGSTRMKSGTAQKMILNMISTGTMVSLGKTYSNYMVDLVPTNEKLVQRSINMISNILEISLKQATEIFYKSNKSVSISILMYKKNMSLSEVKELLKKNKFKKLRELI